MSEQGSAVIGETEQSRGDEHRPWICPSCAHFIVRVGTGAVPTHVCEGADAEVDFVPYVDSEQALLIRRATLAPQR